MKKFVAISAVLFFAIISQSKGQHFVASYGVEQHWDVPAYVTHVVYDRYHNYDWVHASRVRMGGGYYGFNVMLQRGQRFIEVNIDHHGYARVINRYNYYPFAGHICGDFCGYHEYYYNSYYRICHSHNHFGHNHVFYNPRPVTYVYGHYRTYPRYRTTVIYNNGPSKSYKHYTQPKHKPQYSQQQPRRTRVEYEQRNSYASRRVSPAPVERKEYSKDSRRSEDSRYERDQKSSRSSSDRYERSSRSSRSSAASRSSRSSNTRSKEDSRSSAQRGRRGN